MEELANGVFTGGAVMLLESEIEKDYPEAPMATLVKLNDEYAPSEIIHENELDAVNEAEITGINVVNDNITAETSTENAVDTATSESKNNENFGVSAICSDENSNDSAESLTVTTQNEIKSETEKNTDSSADTNAPTESVSKETVKTADENKTCDDANTAKPLAAQLVFCNDDNQNKQIEDSVWAVAKIKIKKPKVKKADSEVTADAVKPDEQIIEAGDSTIPHGKFVIKKTDKGNFVYKLYSYNHRVIAIGAEQYASLATCKVGVLSVISNAESPVEDLTLKTPNEKTNPKWQIYADKAGQIRLRLFASNGNIVATTNDGYCSKGAAKKGIEAIARAAKGADIVRNDNLW